MCEKKEDLSETEQIFKFYNAPLFLDKLEALKALALRQKDNAVVQELLFKALQDKNWNIRQEALELIETDKYANKAQLSLAIQNIINTDAKSSVREKAINKIARIEKSKSVEILQNVLDKDSSYSCLIAALNNLSSYNKPKAYAYAVQLSSKENPDLMTAVAKVFKDTTADNFDFFKKAIWLNTPRSSYPNFKSFGEYLEKANNTVLEKGILFLKDISTYEESDYNTEGAKQLVRNMHYSLTEKAKKDKQADIRLQIVKKTGKELLN